jgi:hypothetical protein
MYNDGVGPAQVYGDMIGLWRCDWLSLESREKAMKLSRMGLIVAVLVLQTADAWAQTVGAAGASLDVGALIGESLRNGKRMSGRVFDYTWTSRNTTREANKRGEVTKETVRVYEVFPVPSRAYVVQKLISVNGSALSPKRAAKEQQRVMAELMLDGMMPVVATLDEVTPALADEKRCPAFGIWTELEGFGGKTISFGVSDFLCACEFSAPRTTQIHERETIMLNFRPRPDFIPEVLAKAPIAKLQGTIWIDAKDKVVARIEAWPALSIAKNAQETTSEARPAPALVFEDIRLPDGMWVRSLRHLNTIPNPSLFNGVNVEWRQEFSDYKRYNTEFKDYRLDAPKAQP